MKFVTYRIWDKEEEYWRNDTELYAILPITYTEEEIKNTLTNTWLINTSRQEIIIEDIKVSTYCECEKGMMKFTTYNIWDNEKNYWTTNEKLYAIFPLAYVEDEIKDTLTMEWALDTARSEIIIEDIKVADYIE